MPSLPSNAQEDAMYVLNGNLWKFVKGEWICFIRLYKEDS